MIIKMTTKITYLTAFLLLVCSVSCVFAQNRSSKTRDAAEEVDIAAAYTVLKPVMSELSKRDEVTRLLQSGTLDDEAKTTVNNYLQRYELARWTDPKNVAEYPKYKKELQSIITNVSNPQGKEFLLSRLTVLLSGFATKTDFLPACRYNAVLALGELDTGQTDGRPTPYLRALQRLLQIYANQGDGTDPAHEAIRLGALLGIRRHVILGITNAKARNESVPELLISIVADTPYKKDEAAEETSSDSTDRTGVRSVVVTVEANAKNISEKHRTVDQHNWFRNRAIDTLGYMNNTAPETQQKIIDALLNLIENEVESPSIQYAAAYALSNYTTVIANSPEMLPRTTETLLKLGLAVQKDGILTMIAEKSTQQSVGSFSGGGSSGMDMGGMGGGMSSSLSSGGSGNSAQMQADQINNSLIQIKDGFSSMQACLIGTGRDAGGLVNSESVKNTRYHEILVNLNQTIQACVKFFDEGDPEAKKRAALVDTSRMSGDSSMGMSSTGGTATTTTVVNQPKVTMKEIEDRLRILKNAIEALQNQLKNPVSTAGTTAASR